jgi:hypothetical protein
MAPGCSSDFHIFPAVILSVGKDAVYQHAQYFRRFNQRMANVRKWNRNSPSSGKSTLDFHDRDEPDYLFVSSDCEIKRFIPVGIMDHTCPGGCVKESGMLKRNQQIIPVRLGKRIYDGYFFFRQIQTFYPCESRCPSAFLKCIQIEERYCGLYYGLRAHMPDRNRYAVCN